MKVKEFITILEQQQNKELLFAYGDEAFVGANYHLTEVKNVQFDTTDCGGKTNFWEETHFQLWESPQELGKRDYMTTDKIASILRRVDGIKPLKLDSPLKFEYGNDRFATSVMPVEHVHYEDNRVLVYLYPESTLCKANDQKNIDLEKQEEAACCSGSNCC